MQWLGFIGSIIGPELLLTREHLKAGVFVSLLSVWVLVALFYYLNRFTKRRYFSIWTAAWLFYALWITLSFDVQGDRHDRLVLMLQQTCVGIAAIFLLWGSMDFLGERVRQSQLVWFMSFLVIWSYVGAFHLSQPMEMEVPVFSLIAVASATTSFSFFKYRRRHPYIAATLLTLGFFLWGVYMAVYPFLENSEDLTSLALFLSAGLQLMLAVSMIILVLEEVRQTHIVTLEEAANRKAERDALQTRMRSTEQRYKRLFEQAGEALIIADAGNFNILELNQAAEHLLGVGRTEAEHLSLTTFCEIPETKRATPLSGAELFQALCRQRPLNLTRKNGSIAQVEINGTPVDYDGKPAYQFFLVEVTERARLEQQLRQAEKLSAIGQMISGVAHELNNPLSVVKGYLELILAHHDLNPNTRADLEKAAHESNRAAKLVMNFLSFAREQRSPQELVHLNELIRRIIELRHFDLVVAKTEVILDLATELPPVSADPDQIQQLLVNLTNNALQAMVDLPRPGCLKIKTCRVGELVQVFVEDNGPGVPEHLLTKIFEPFFTTKDVGTGTGLGLSIAHSIMTELKGRIFYQASSLGGAGFVLEFPAAQSSAPKPKGEATTTFITKLATPASQPPCAGNILVLDDEKFLAEMLGEMLGLLGYTATLSHSAAHALELMDRQEFDLVISDFRMPGINGRQFFEMAVKKKPSLAARIIFLTGDVVNEETQAFLQSIGTPHLAKPFNLTSVKTTVGEMMKRMEKAAQPECVEQGGG